MTPDLYDTRDEQEHAEVAAPLAELPASYPARDAYGGAAATIELTHLFTDRHKLLAQSGLENGCGPEKPFWQMVVD